MNKKLFFVSVCLVMFAANFANSAQGVLLSSYIDFYGLHSASQGLMSTFQSAGCVAACLCILFIAGRIKRWYILIFSAASLFLSMLLIGAKPVFFLLLSFYFIIGLGYASASNVSSSLASDLYKGSSGAMGMVHAFFGLGGLLAPLVLQAALDRISWNWVCVLDAVVIMLVLIFYLISLKSSKQVICELKDTGNKISAADVRAFFSRGRNILLLIGTFGYMAYQNGVNVWISRYTSVELGTADLGALTLSLFWVGNTIARLTVTRIKVRTELLFSAGCLISAAAFGVGLMANNSVTMLVCIIICGIASGASIPQLYHMGCTWNHESSLLPTSVLGLTMFISCMITAPVTASLTSYGLLAGMISVLVYVFIGGMGMLPLALKKQD